MPYHGLGATHELISAPLQLYSLLHRPLNLYLEEVHILPFLEGYLPSTFAVYKGYTNALKYIRRFEPNVGSKPTMLLCC